MTKTKCRRTGKTVYRTKLDAELVRAKIVRGYKTHRKNPRAEEPVRSYRCEFCAGWHHTSQAKGRGSGIE